MKEEIQETEAWVFLSNRGNSTMFTTCCEVAILDRQKQCPKCQKYVYGHDSINEHQRGIKRWQYAYKR